MGDFANPAAGVYYTCSGDEMHKLMVMALMATAAANVGFAQSTWNDLKFGMTIAEVRTSLAKQGLTLQRSDAEWQVTPGWDLRLAGLKIAFHFSPRLYFSSGDRLERITLGLKTAQHASEGTSAVVLTSLAASHITKQLVSKYGPPVRKEGPCDSVDVMDLVGHSPRILKCSALWTAPGQTVTLTWSHFERSLDDNELVYFNIQYLAALNRGL
jgi:hypothetical protein